MAVVTYLAVEHEPTTLTGRVDGDRILTNPDALAELTGWVLKPEGLCRGEVCVPVLDPDLAVDGDVDLARFAAVLGRPAVVDSEAQVVAIGEPSGQRRGPIEAGMAPDFTLPRLEGGAFTFSSIGQRKKLLLAWASW